MIDETGCVSGFRSEEVASTLDGEEVKRQVAPADDEVYSVEYRLRAGSWVKK